MIDWPAIGIIILTAAIHAGLQLGTGTLLMLYKESLGKHIKRRTKLLAGNYIVGSEVLTALAVGASCFVILATNNKSLNLASMFVSLGILVALAICMWGFYYKVGRSTELWLPKIVAKYIRRRVKRTESKTEAFSLGMLASFAEMPFSLVLVVLAANSILALPKTVQLAMVALYVLVVHLPQNILRLRIRHGQTVVEVQKWRVENKIFFKTMSGVGFLVLAGFILAFKVIGS